MPITLVDPEGLPKIDLYHQVAVATGTRHVHVAGQVASDATGTTVGVGDLAAQTAQALRNVSTALEAVGATPDDVVRLTVYVVGWTPDKMPALVDGLTRAGFTTGSGALPPASMFGVETLDIPEHMVEIEATAIMA